MSAEPDEVGEDAALAPVPEVPCDPAFRALVVEEMGRLWADLPASVRHGFLEKFHDFALVVADEPDPSAHDGNTEVFGDFVQDGGWARVGVYRGPIERAAPQTGLATREHVHRVLLHELGHAAGMQHGDFPEGV